MRISICRRNPWILVDENFNVVILYAQMNSEVGPKSDQAEKKAPSCRTCAYSIDVKRSFPRFMVIFSYKPISLTNYIIHCQWSDGVCFREVVGKFLLSTSFLAKEKKNTLKNLRSREENSLCKSWKISRILNARNAQHSISARFFLFVNLKHANENNMELLLTPLN